jgi:hypothetical protein
MDFLPEERKKQKITFLIKKKIKPVVKFLTLQRSSHLKGHNITIIMVFSLEAEKIRFRYHDPESESVPSRGQLRWYGLTPL